MLTHSRAVQGARCLLLLIVIMTRGSYHQWVGGGIDRLSQPACHQWNQLKPESHSKENPLVKCQQPP